MSRAIDYLAAILTPDQYAEYKRQAALDSRDSTARQKWRYVKDHRKSWTDLTPDRRDKTVRTCLAWLKQFGYVDDAGQWTGLTKENP